ncbi:hypothetical protein ACOVAC_002135 [Enterococcus hirae]|nr:hypothetical protein [Enterococcus hirae]
MSFEDKWDKMLGLVTGTNDPQMLKAVIEVQRDMSKILQENKMLRDEINDLKNEQILDSELKYRNGVYTKGKDIFCSVCWDRDKRLSRVRKVKQSENGNTAYSCDICKQWRFSDIKWE